MDQFTFESDLSFQNKILSCCIYCGGLLPAKSQEHIFNSCWGGTHKTGQLICDTCNNTFSKIDHSFGPYTKFVMNAWQFKGQRHKDVPIITTLSGYTIEKGAKPKRKSALNYDHREDGSLGIHASVNSKGEARKLLLDQKELIEQQLSRTLTVDEVEKIREQIRKSNVTEEPVEKLLVEETLRIVDEYRSATHTLIKCMAMFDPQTAVSTHTSKARNFARYGEGNWEEFALNVSANVSFVKQISYMEVRYNAAEIFYSRLLGNIIGVITVLGRVKRCVVLSREYTGPDQVLSVFERINSGGRIQSRRLTASLTLPPIPLIDTHFEQPTYDQFLRELSVIAQDSVSIDAPYAVLINSLKGLSNKYKVVDEVCLNEYTEVFLTYLKAFSALVKAEFDIQEMKKQIWDLGFTELLTQFNMASLSDPVIHEKLNHPFNVLFTKISETVKNAE